MATSEENAREKLNLLSKDALDVLLYYVLGSKISIVPASLVISKGKGFKTRRIVDASTLVTLSSGMQEETIRNVLNDPKDYNRLLENILSTKFFFNFSDGSSNTYVSLFGKYDLKKSDSSDSNHEYIKEKLEIDQIGCNHHQCNNKASISCGGCYKAYYCSQKCRRDHWENHKITCEEKERK